MDLTTEEETIVCSVIADYDKNYDEVRTRDGLEDTAMMRLSYYSGVVKTLRRGQLLLDYPEHLRKEVLRTFEDRAEETVAELVKEQHNQFITPERLKKWIGL